MGSGHDVKVCGTKPVGSGARRISINTGHLHVRIDALGTTPVGVRLAKHRTEQDQCIRALRLQVQFGDGDLLIVRRGLVRDLEDMLDLIDLRGLPFRTPVWATAPRRRRKRRRVRVTVQKDAAEMRAAPTQRIDRLSARTSGWRPRALLLRLLHLAALFDVFGSEKVEGRVEGARGTHTHRADKPSEWSDAPLGTLGDVVGSDEGHVLRVPAVHAAGESSAFPSS